MESSLYDERTGFYSKRIQKDDFYTAPELHESFGIIVADTLAELLKQVLEKKPFSTVTLVEAGCGDATLASQILLRFKDCHTELLKNLNIYLVERSHKDRELALHKLKSLGIAAEVLPDIKYLPTFSGVLYCNELFDAFPVHLLQKRNGQIHEVYVENGGQQSLGPISNPELFEQAQQLATSLVEGQYHGINCELTNWLHMLSTKMDSGFLLTSDYGKCFNAGVGNIPRAYRQHRIAQDMTNFPGQTDITMPVDFTTVISTAKQLAFELKSYQTLSTFLIEGGIESFLKNAQNNSMTSYKELSKIKTLLHPEAMGEVFKVLLLSRSLC